MVGCVEGILGMRPDAEGLIIDPAIPSDWKEYTVEKNFRGAHLSMKFENPNGVESGVKEIILNGEKLDGNRIDGKLLKAQNDITVVLG
jgi:cellobiose phosphorylase